VTRVGTRSIATFIAAVLVAALLAACGGSDSEASSTSGSATEPGTNAQGGSQSQGSQGNSSKSASGQSDSQPRGSRDSADNHVVPLKVSGGGSAQFRTKGGDNSIQEFGDESSESELQEAAEVVHGFYAARAKKEWSKACSYLAKSNIEQLEQLGSQSPQLKSGGCAPILRAFTRPLPAAANRQVTTVDAGSLRHEGEQGFLIYFGAGHARYAMPLRDEGGTW
jgi:hypothetical protein